MTNKTERITILTTPDFKTFVTDEAAREGVSVAELIRNRVTSVNETDPDEEILIALIKQVTEATRRANKSLDRGLKAADETIRALRKAKAA